MATVDTLLVKIQADMEGLKRQLNRAEKAVDKSVNQQSKSFKRLGTVFKGVVGVVIASQVTRFAGSMISMASAIEEMESKASVVFGEFLGMAKGQFEEFGNTVGRATSELLKMGASVQDTFVPLGFARGEAAKLSVDLTKLAVDVASFNNAQDADTMRAFQSALVGNHEAVRRFGIVITETELKAELQRMGIRKNIQLVTAQEKVQARLNLIIAGSSDAIGDATRTAGSFENTTKGLQASLIELNEVAVKPLLPALASLVKQITAVVEFFKDIVAITPDEAFEKVTRQIEKTSIAIERTKKSIQRLKDAGQENTKAFKLFQRDLKLQIEQLNKLTTTERALNNAKRIGIEEDLIRISITKEGTRENKKLFDATESLMNKTEEHNMVVNGASEAQILFHQTLMKAGGGLESQQKELAKIIPAYLASKKAQEEYSDSIKMAKGFIESNKTETERLQEIVNSLSVAYGSGKISTSEYNESMEELKKQMFLATEQGQRLDKGINSLSSGLADTFVSALETGKLSLRDLGNVVKEVMAEMARDFLKAQIRALILKQVIGAFGGSPTPTLSVGGTAPPVGDMTASGGTVQRGVPTLVGERGPEIFIPNTGGTVRNNMDSKNMMGGNTVVVNQNVNFATGITPTVRAEVMNMLPMIKKETMSAVVDAKQRGGSFGHQLGSSA